MDHHGHDSIVVGFTTTYAINTNVITCVRDLRQVGCCFRVLGFFSTNKTDHHDIAEILLKVTLNTITLTLKPLNISEDYDI